MHCCYCSALHGTQSNTLALFSYWTSLYCPHTVSLHCFDLLRLHDWSIIHNACMLLDKVLAFSKFDNNRIMNKPMGCVYTTPFSAKKVFCYPANGFQSAGFWTRFCFVYIYAFSRQATYSAFRLYVFYQYVCSLGIEPTIFCAADAMLYHWATLSLCKQQMHANVHLKVMWLCLSRSCDWTPGLTNAPISSSVTLIILSQSPDLE